jgi:hypothetical protein
MRTALAVLALVTSLGLLSGRARADASDASAWPSLAEEGAAIGHPGLAPRLLLQDAPAYAPPGTAVEPAPVENVSITERWWFWAAVGGVVAATVVVVLIAGHAPSAPSSTLGNMNAFGGR